LVFHRIRNGHLLRRNNTTILTLHADFKPHKGGGKNACIPSQQWSSVMNKLTRMEIDKYIARAEYMRAQAMQQLALDMWNHAKGLTTQILTRLGTAKQGKVRQHPLSA
jgi:hypothetical protein